MASIDNYLKAILAAIHGEEVRGSIHDAIKAINTECETGVSTTSSYATQAKTAATTANTAKNDAVSAKNSASTYATTATNQAKLAKSYASQAMDTLPAHAVITTDDGTATGVPEKYATRDELNHLRSLIGSKSHVGQLIFSTTLDTMEKVIAEYGGTKWVLIEDCVISGKASGEVVGQIVGSNTITLTESQVPSHKHSIPALSGSTSTKSLKGTFWSYTAKKIFGANSTDANDFIYMSSTGTSVTPSTTSGSGTSGSTIGINATHNHTVTTTASNTGNTGSGASVDVRSKRFIAYVWHRTA